MTRPSRSEYLRQWRLKNLDRERAREQRWRDANIGKVNAGTRKWRKENPEKARKCSASWRERNKGVAAKLSDDWRRKNQRRVNDLQNERYKKNPEIRKAYAREWYKKNAEVLRERDRAWKKANPERGRAQCQRRSARKSSQLHPDNDRSKELGMYKKSQYAMETIGGVFHVDHIIPLAVGGWHHHDNLQVLPYELNLAKNDNPFWEHPGYKSWRDVPEHLWPKKLQPSYYALLLI